MKGLCLLFLLFLPALSCNKVTEYFRDPDTAALTETIHSAALTAYAADVAVSVIKGHANDNVTYTRSNPGFPCTTLIQISPDDYRFAADVNAVTVAGLWADENTAVLSVIYTDYHSENTTLDILGIETIPLLCEGNSVHVALAKQDISLNPDVDALLSINLNTLQIQSELIRLDVRPPDDVYVAVVQNAYFIDINTKGSFDDLEDDDYILTGGGQLVNIEGNDVEIIQEAMVNLLISSDCQSNPIDGMALIRVTGLEDQGFPELGTTVLEFRNQCDGTAGVYAATGMYVASNGKRIRFRL
ncbi:MAG TPA: hypothetical protein VK179_02440 [Bacteroidales bacterium]|nr:hypothetical protein [Bacteroidales bacterium]